MDLIRQRIIGPLSGLSKNAWSQYLLALAVVSLALLVARALPDGPAGAVALLGWALLVLVVLVRRGPFLVGGALAGLGVILALPLGSVYPGWFFAVVAGALAVSVAAQVRGQAKRDNRTLPPEGVAPSWDNQLPPAPHADALLRERELVDFSNEVFVPLHWVDAEGIILRVNQAELDWLGYTRDEYVGCNIAEFHVRPEALAEGMARLQQGEALRGFPARMRAKDGTIKDVLVDSRPVFENGELVHTRTVTRDVTAIKESHRSAALLAAVVSSSDDAIVAKGLDGTIQSWNEGAQRLFGYSAQEAIGKHISLIIPPDRLAEEDTIISELEAGRRVDHYDTVRLARDGREVPVSLTISPIRDDKGRVIGASKIARDITARRLAEQTRRDMARRKDEFIATLAHELRNPLAPISSSIQLLGRIGDEPAARARIQATLERQVGALVRLVDDLLDLNRISHDRLELRTEPITLQSVVQQAREMVEALYQERSHHLMVSLPPEPVLINADQVRLVQVIGNLLHNAGKYTHPGGRISLSASVVDSEVTLAVEDNGVGIPPARLKHIFEMFSRADQRPEHNTSGLGIGLNIARRLAELHGGSLTADSTEGVGSRFTLRLPVLTHTESQAEAASIAPATTASRKIMVVDDSMDAATSLAELLELLGHQTRVAHNGPDALLLAASFRPDVILLDIGMPGMNGYDVCQRLRQEPWGRSMVVVALTGWGQPEDRRRAREAGFDNHLVKPADFQELESILSELPAPTSVNN